MARKYTQEARLLGIKTPLGEDYFLLQHFEAREAISELYEIKVELYHHDNRERFKHNPLKPADILGKSATIRIDQYTDDADSRHFSGIFNTFSQGTRNDTFSIYHATIVPNVWVLTQKSQSRIFQHKSVPDILKAVLQGFTVSLETTRTYEPRNYIVQYRETDWDFVSRLMEEEGIYYYFVHDGQMEKLIISDSPQSYRECPNNATFPFHREELDEDVLVTAIKTWHTDHVLQTGKVALRDYNFQLPAQRLDIEQPSRFAAGDNQNLEMYDYPGGYSHNYDGIEKGGGESAGDLHKIYPDRENTAKVLMEALDSRFEVSFGTSQCAPMTAGHKFTMTGHPTAEINRTYLITAVNHRADQHPDYFDDRELESPYTNEFECIPHGGDVPAFRPGRKTKKPKIYGSQTAVVVGPSGEEIFTDKFGRVKVEFKWDRESQADASSSCWVRVSTSIAGNNWGTMLIPRIGQEVVVDFLEGDPDRPIITGSVYNAMAMPHYELPKFKTLSYFKSRTSPDDGKGFNELRFEDKKGKEQVFVHSQKRYDLRVRGAMYETCGGSRQEVIGLKDPENPGGNLTVTIAGCHDFHVKEAEYIGIDQKRNETVKGEVVEDYQSSQITLVKTKRSLNAQEIIMEATSKISLKVGASCIVIEPGLITIAAQMVKINSGGFGTETGDPAIDDPLDAELSDNGEPGYLDRPRTGGGRGGRNRRQLKSQHHAYPPRKDEDPAFTAMRNRLNTSAQGRHALEVFERNNVRVTNNPGGTTYNSGTDTVNLDPARAADAAPGFVHEMGHAEADHGGTSADVEAQERAAYVDTQLREDAAAERRAYEAEEQMNAAGGSERYNSSTRTTYQNALAAERARLQAAEPGISNEELNRRSHDAAEAAILNDYRDGNVMTGNTTPPQSYVDYWGSDHDRRHASGTPGPAPDPHEH